MNLGKVTRKYTTARADEYETYACIQRGDYRTSDNIIDPENGITILSLTAAEVRSDR